MNEQLTLQQPEYERRLSDGLDFYKLTMGQVALEQFPTTEVTFTLKNRDVAHPLSEYVSVDALQERLNVIQDRGFTPEEIAAFAGIQAQNGEARFDEQYLDFLADIKLPDVSITINPETQDFDIASTGPWASVSLWETIVMSEVNEQYYEGLLESEGIDIEAIWKEGDRRLDEKIAILKEHPEIKFADFGTRRRFSAKWHEHVISRLAHELPENLIGTSNPWLAHKYGLAPIGTYAHEMPMVYSAIADRKGKSPLEGHKAMMQDWFDRYGSDLSIALTDTFTSDFFFSDFSPEEAAAWRGLRHDSGDPIEFGEKAIKFYEGQQVDPATKTLTFSDGLDINTILKLSQHFEGQANNLFGWGTSLMNDLGIRANNFVMKATHVDGIATVKLSDSEGKHTGPTEQVDRYKALVNARTRVAEVFQELARV